MFDPIKVKVDITIKDNSVSFNHKPLKYYDDENSNWF